MLRSYIALFALLSACDGEGPRDAGPDAGSGGDAGADAAADAGPESMATLPALPDFGACPEGWRAVDREGITVCDPWPESGIESCDAADEAHFAGTPGCARVGTACADFAEGLPATDVIFVRAGALGGDGTRARPFGTIAQAIAAATAGTTIALSGDRFVQDQIDLPAGVTLWGACTLDTVLRSESESLDADAGVVDVRAAGAGLRNLRIEGRRPGIVVHTGGSLAVRDVVVQGAESWGVYAFGGTITGEGLVIRDTAEYMGFDIGEGLYARDGAQVTLAHVVLERNFQAGVELEGTGTRVDLTDVAVRDTRMGTTLENRGFAVRALLGASGHVERAAIDRNFEHGIAAYAGSAMTVRDAAIRDVTQARSSASAQFGAGVLAVGGSSLEGDRVWIERASHVAALAFQAGSTLTLRDALVRETQLAPMPEEDRWGMGVGADDAGALVLERTAVVASTFIGIWVQENSTLLATDVVVSDTQSTPRDGLYGRGIEALSGAEITITRALFQRNRSIAVSGVDVGTTFTIEDLTVRDTLPRTLDDRYGYGIAAAGGARFSLARADLAASRGIGIAAFDAGTAVEGSEVFVRDTALFDCAATSCAGDDFGYAVASYDGATVDLSMFALSGSASAALQLANGGEADLMDGVVEDAPIGFNVQTAGFDSARLRGGVTFRNVTVELDLSALLLGTPVDRIPPFGI